MVLSHPYMEDYVVLPTRAAVRKENRLTTSKTWDPARHHGFWSEDSSTHGPAASASRVSSTNQRPRLRADGGMSSNAGDTSGGSTTGLR